VTGLEAGGGELYTEKGRLGLISMMMKRLKEAALEEGRTVHPTLQVVEIGSLRSCTRVAR
jgi:hypothetical protein